MIRLFFTERAIKKLIPQFHAAAFSHEQINIINQISTLLETAGKLNMKEDRVRKLIDSIFSSTSRKNREIRRCFLLAWGTGCKKHMLEKAQNTPIAYRWLAEKRATSDALRLRMRLFNS